ncbi:hypothetical protein [Desulfovibrio sp. UCD-KL4C]|uniref:hypothetical protein n=1 Tax=Desulfovibrio sp. UCD-KL4C TaxID=2578120 RepID=UPI0025C2BE11|nr:hypothetical protein [Desulfovibrio sp. UCD-KL4C]
MSIKSKIDSHKKYNPVLKQTTIRISKESLERIKKYAKENKIKEGTLLRILIEDGIEKIDGDGEQGAEDPVAALREEVSFLSEELENMQKEFTKLRGKRSGDL